MSERQKPVLVFGGTGFLGRQICHALRDHGHHAIAIGRNPEKIEALKAEGFEACAIDLAGKDAAFEVRELLHERSAAGIVNAAGTTRHWGRRDSFKAGNIDPAQVCVHLKATQKDMRVVQISSASVYADIKDQKMIREDAGRPKPISAYAETKAAADDLIHRAFGRSCVILRPRAIVGKGDNALFPALIKAAGSGPIPRVTGARPKSQFTHVTDVARAAVLAYQSPVDKVCGRTFHIAGKETVDLHGLIEAVCSLNNTPVEWKDLPLPVMYWSSKFMDLVGSLFGKEPPMTPYLMSLLTYDLTLDCRAAERAFGWTPQVTFDTSFNEMFSAPPPHSIVSNS